jgi:AcrR family transcriptional regulator
MSVTPIAITPIERNAGRTRARILAAAYNEIHRRGYHGMRLDDVLESTGLTKGALYYHFPNKMALGYAVVDEVLEEKLVELWIRPLEQSSTPLDTLIDRVQRFDRFVNKKAVILGCPLNNLAQEMSPLDEGFRLRLDRLFQVWHIGIVTALERAKKTGQMRAEVNSSHTATLVMAGLEGGVGLTKNAQSMGRLKECTSALSGYLRTLVVPSADTNI